MQNGKNVVVLGSDQAHLDLMAQERSLERFNLVSALTFEECQPPSETVDFDRLYEKARSQLDAMPEPPAGLVAYYDFPVTSLAALLRRDFGLPGASVTAVAACEHKYWMRCAQQAVMPERTPRFSALNPFDPDGAIQAAPPFPFWVKPIKGHSSVLGFRVENEKDLRKALKACRQKIHLFGSPFNQFLAHVDDIPDEVRAYDGNFAIAEEMITAPEQFTLEGYVFSGQIRFYGAVFSVRGGKSQSSFSRFQYPADLPEDVMAECQQMTEALIGQLGYDNSPFNIEFFWDPDSGALNLLEINPRISKSHAPLFKMVDGVSHQKLAAEMSVGERPTMPVREGRDRCAAKFMLRSYEEDGVVVRMPSDSELDELRRILPDIKVDLIAREGTRLSEMPFQDSYSYELADVFLGAQSGDMLEDAYRRCVDTLTVHIKPMPESV